MTKLPCRRFALLLLGAMAADQQPKATSVDDCPERCGVVLKLCLEQYRKRHQCVALTDECLTACKVGERVLDAHGEVLLQWRPKPGDDEKPIRW